MELFSEPFPATGTIAARGAKESLGRPHLDNLVVLVREAVQNSWDARLDGSIRFSLNGVQVAGNEIEGWRDVFARIPGDDLPLRGVLAEPSLEVLYVSDRATTGLTGPTRADRISDDGKDFVDLLRNVGEPRDKEHGGGTYGYGKSIFYIVSKASTAVFYTRTWHDGELQSRLMAAALGDRFEKRGVPYTGRHWWGEVRDGVIEPILGEPADEVATALGFPAFEDGSTGTSIAILGIHGFTPEGDFRTANECMQVMAEAITWHCWPKFGLGNRDEIEFSVSWNGSEVPIPGGREIPVLEAYRSALLDIVESDTPSDPPHESEVHTIASQRPAQDLGRLAIRHTRFKQTPYRPLVPPLTGPSHHVALMRDPRIVVKYLEGPPLPSDLAQWSGVFHASKAVDDSFAKSEPPSHDDWVSEGLERPHKTFVNVAYRRIADVIRESLAPGQVESGFSTAVPLGALSSRLGSLIGPSEGTGGRASPRPSAGSGPRRRGGVRVLSERLIESPDRSLIVEFEAEPSGSEARVKVTPRVLVDARRAESEPPEGAWLPVVKEMTVGDVSLNQAEATITERTVCSVTATVPDDTMVRLEITLVDNDGSR